MPTSSTSMVPLNIVSALLKAAEHLSATGWAAQSDVQRKFLDQFYAEKDNLHLFSPNELRAWVDTVAERLNNILKQEGFSLRFDPFAPGEFGVLSILDVAVAWLSEGTPSLAHNATQHATVHMKDFAEIDGKRTALFTGLITASHPHPVARLSTKSGDVVFMTIAGEGKSGFDLMAKIDELRASQFEAHHFGSLIFPMVDFEETKLLNWLIGMRTVGASQGMEVAMAAQQTKFKMNHTGARVKDAVILTMRGISLQEKIDIDKPFFLWIERPGIGKPIFYGYLDESVWKDPGNLDM